jgi:hypothetical protein
MYAGAMLYLLGMPLLLGSWWGVVAVPLLVAGMAPRAVGEERMLRRALRLRRVRKAGQVPADSGHLVKGGGLSFTRVCSHPLRKFGSEFSMMGANRTHPARRAESLSRLWIYASGDRSARQITQGEQRPKLR